MNSNGILDERKKEKRTEMDRMEVEEEKFTEDSTSFHIEDNQGLS